MQAEQFFGAYLRFHTVSKKEAAPLVGADSLVGDRFSIEFKQLPDSDEVDPRAWIVNKFGAWVGYFDADQSRRLNIMKARGWKLNALLSFVAYTDEPEPGRYWGEVALLCYDETLSDAFDPFVENMGKMLARDVRPEIALGDQAVAEVVSSHGAWVPVQRRKLPELDKGTVLIKAKQSATERIIELSRARNKGCYAASWAIIILFLAAVLFGLKSCGVF